MAEALFDLVVLTLGGIGRGVIAVLRRLGAWGDSPAPDWLAVLLGIGLLGLLVMALGWAA